MQENNFEREVRLKTGELKIKPSEEVWQKVAVAIEKRKTGRRLVGFVLLLLLLAGSGIVVWMTKKPAGQPAIAVHPNYQPVEKKQPIQNLNADRTDLTKTINETNNPATDSHLPIATKRDKARKPSLSKPGVRTVITNATIGEENGKLAADQSSQGTSKNIHYSSRQKLHSKQTGGGIGEEDETGPTTKELFAVKVMLADNQPVPMPGTAGFQTKTLITGLSHDSFALVTNSTAVTTTLNPVKQNAATKKASSWKIGFLLSGGASATRSGYLGVIGINGSGESKAFDPLQSNVGSGTTAPPPSATSYSPSRISAGPAMAAGVFARRNISPRTRLSVGLNYAFYSSVMSVGNRFDTGTFYSQFGSFYLLGNRSNYHNHFHFIELPIALQYRLNKAQQAPIFLQAGISVSQLLQSNALQFDAQSGNYYSDNSKLKKTQLSITTSLLFTLSRHATNALAIGPELHFGLTPMAGAGLYAGRRYSYAGLLLQKTIGKK